MVTKSSLCARILLSCILFTAQTTTVMAARPTTTDSLAALEVVRGNAIRYMLGAAGEGTYRKKALQETDAWVEKVLQQAFQPLAWEESAAQIMNERLADRAAELRRLAVAYRSEGSRFEGNEKVRERIAAGLENILEHFNPGTPRPGNWYDWLIRLPNFLGAMGLLMEDDLPSAALNGLKETLRNELSPELVLTGTNASWEARNHIYLALLDRDLNRLERAAEYVFRSVRFAPRQGIREDYAYLFHGNIPYAGGYGSGFAQTVSEFIFVFDETPWSIKPVHRDIIVNLLMEHTRWFLADGKIDLHVRGRSFQKEAGNWNSVLQALLVLSQTNDPRRTEIAETVAAMLKARPDIDLGLTSGGFADKLTAREGKLPLGFRYWPTAEIGIHRQPGYHVSFRQFTKRVQDYEYLMREDGGEGGEGWNLPYGFTNIHRPDGANNWYHITGPSEGMLPEIDLKHLPGTTSRFGSEPVNPPFKYDPNVPTRSTTGFSLNFGKSDFGGGVGWQDGGVAGFILQPVYGEFTAKKSLHFFPGGYWALGSGIRSVSPSVDNKSKPVHTTVLQWVARKSNPVLKLNGKSVQPANGSEQVYKKTKWFWLEDENVAVVFQTPSDISVRLKGRALTVWINHGADPAGASYAYAVLPRISLKDAASFERTKPFAPVRHDEKVHAVANVSNDHVGIVFFEGGESLGISSKTPAIVFRKGGGDGGVMSIQNPLHTKQNMQIQAEGVKGKITSPDKEVAVATDAKGGARIDVSSVLGRIYRFGYGATGARVEGAPRKDLHVSSYDDFRVEAESNPEETIITVHLPEDAVDSAYKLSVHFSKSQRFHDFTEEDVVDRPTRNTVRYRWKREPGIGPPVFAEYFRLTHGNFKVMLFTELLIVDDDIKVPKF